MWLKTLKIKHFRNYQSAEVDFDPGLNIFLGQNAQGKTNILEAIYFLALTRSHRTRTDKDLIHFQEKNLQISGIIEKTTGKIPLDIELTPKGRITKINHLKQGKLSGLSTLFYLLQKIYSSLKVPLLCAENSLILSLGKSSPSIFLTCLTIIMYSSKEMLILRLMIR